MVHRLFFFRLSFVYYDIWVSRSWVNLISLLFLFFYCNLILLLSSWSWNPVPLDAAGCYFQFLNSWQCIHWNGAVHLSYTTSHNPISHLEVECLNTTDGDWRLMFMNWCAHLTLLVMSIFLMYRLFQYYFVISLVPSGNNTLLKCSWNISFCSVQKVYIKWT